ncbi:MAG: hypothetical protein PVI03_07070 [Candidatus Thorarchaeota archaeon]|jgi:hypothetical protein
MATKAQQIQELREACENSLWFFANTVEPHRVYGECHKELFNWWQEHYEGGEGLDNLLVLYPRDHQKSHCMAVLAAWLITKDPAVTILYVSATSTLAEKQLHDIKNILTSNTYTLLWPEMVNPDEGRRERWNNVEIMVDHPKRKEEGVRDATVFAAGLTTNTTGLHCRILMKDDVVVPENAYTAENRRKVAAACSQMASILTTGGHEFVVGTRYHPKDHYEDLKQMKEEIFNEEGEAIDERKVYEIKERPVEENGTFLWPKEFRASDGKPFGFDWKELARKKAKYLDKTQFFAQYYNNPNDVENQRIDRGQFVYYDRKRLKCEGGTWYYEYGSHGEDKRKLNVYAGIDFAFSQSKKADSTCIVVIGVDYEFNIYVLDIERFKTNKMETYFENILTMHNKWDFRMLRAEISVAQEAIVEYLKDRAKASGMSLRIEGHRPNRHMGAKEERIAAALEPRYQNMQILHYKGGYCGMLEEELMLENPPHDDIKDTLAIIVSGNIHKPSQKMSSPDKVTNIQYHPRFGGMM